MNELRTFEEVRSKLNYDFGLVQAINQTHSPVQRQHFVETIRHISEIDAIYFSGDIPVIYFRLLSEYNEEDIKDIHRRIWNQNRIPLLYIVTPGELRIYNCFETPAQPGEATLLDSQERLVRHFNLAAGVIEELDVFSRSNIDSGVFWKSSIGRYFRSTHRVDQRLLSELQQTREHLRTSGLGYNLIHNLLGRSIFILYLEDRGAIKPNYYERFQKGAVSYLDILVSKDATYALFELLEQKFNGDLFPTHSERQVVEAHHLLMVQALFGGTNMTTGQQMLWRPYDFGIIPIEFVSAIYEQFLHKEEGKDYTSSVGAYYTPHPLVEFILNEVLPWPSPKDSRYDLRILDPACGSGIFLVESFRRLVARWLYSEKTDQIPHEKLCEILTGSIYGIDINVDAIRVAAFSLYLALLDYLEPTTIWEEFRFPHLVYNTKQVKSDGKNLFPLDAFPFNDSEKLPFENIDYDIVVGNPPWKRNGLPSHISEYCQKHNFAQELAQAFLWRVRDFVSNSGKIALVGTSKILFNIEGPDSNFRRQFFSNSYVETVINFSALRKSKGSAGRQLFASAVGPAAVFIYRVSCPAHPEPTLLYCTPKPSRSDTALSGIIIDSSEIKFLPREDVVNIDRIWKVAMWGTHRDLEIIEKFTSNKTIRDYLDELHTNGWNCGRGYQLTGKAPKLDDSLSIMDMIPARKISRYWLDASKLEKVGAKYFFRTGAKKTYSGPHVLIKEGQTNKRFCAAFANFDCAFKDTVTGISGTDRQLLKALTAFLNSSFATYYLFLTASTWGIERERVYPTEVLGLPGIPFQMSQDVIDQLAQRVDDIGHLLSKLNSGKKDQVTEIESTIEKLIYDELDLSESERFLISDVLNYSLDFFQEGERSEACSPITSMDIESYAYIFCKTVNAILQFGQLRAWATIYSGDSPLRLVSIHFNRMEDAGVIEKQNSSTELREALANLEGKIQTEYSESIYVRRNIRFYDGDTLHITKPNEKRFWSRSMALCDADETLAEGIHGAK